MKISFYSFASSCGKDKLFDLNRRGFIVLWGFFLHCVYLGNEVLIVLCGSTTKTAKPLTKALIPIATS